MTSQTDLDQGGTNRQMVRIWMGPSVGWIETPAEAGSVLPITAAGTYQISHSTTLVTVNVNGVVTLKLPRASSPIVPATTLPGRYAQRPITIVDIGGFASAHNITILPFDNTENIMSLTQVLLSVNYGGYTFKPIASQNGWESISP